MAIDSKHLENLRELDTILKRIYKDGINRADFIEVFTKEGDTHEMAFLHTPERQVQAIRYLQRKELIETATNEEGATYSLTFEGILRAWGNTFEAEYRERVNSQIIMERYQKYFLYAAALSIVISIFALVLSTSNSGAD